MEPGSAGTAETAAERAYWVRSEGALEAAGVAERVRLSVYLLYLRDLRAGLKSRFAERDPRFARRRTQQLN